MNIEKNTMRTACFMLLLTIRSLMCFYFGVHEDEGFVGYEPLHFILHKRGVRIHDFNPEVAGMSWVSMWLCAALVKPASFLGQWLFSDSFSVGLFEFYSTRIVLAILSAVSDTSLIMSAYPVIGQLSSILFSLFLAGAPVICVNSTAFIPATISCDLMALAFASFLSSVHQSNVEVVKATDNEAKADDDTSIQKKNAEHSELGEMVFKWASIIYASAAICFGTHFVSVPLIPLFVGISVSKLGSGRWSGTFFACVIGSVLMCGLTILVDSLSYGSFVFPSIKAFNFIVVGIQTPTRESVFGLLLQYVLAFNILVPLAAFSPVALIVWRWLSPNDAPRLSLLAIVCSPWMCFFISVFVPEAQKYLIITSAPLVCLSAASALSFLVTAANRFSKWLRRLVIVFALLLFSLVSVSRTAAVHRNELIPLDVWHDFNRLEYPAAKLEASTLCMKHGWHRFPSSFLLPASMTTKFIDCYDLLLPPSITSFDGANLIVPESEMNKTCQFMFDVQYKGEKNYTDWKVLLTRDVVDQDRSPLLIRYFVVPEFLGCHEKLLNAQCVLFRIE